MAGAKLSVRAAQGIVANLRAEDERAQADYRKDLINYDARVKRAVRRYVPVDKGNMYDNIEGRFTPSGLIVEHGWFADTFASLGLTLYPIYVELGTVHMAARPSLYPAVVLATPILEADLAATTARSLRRAIGRG